MSKVHPDQTEFEDFDVVYLTALSSFAALDVFQASMRTEPFSVREIAQELGKSPAAVGEQVAKLVEAGILFKVGTRKRRSRTESLYLPRSYQWLSNLSGYTKEEFDAHAQMFRCQLKSMDRQFEALHEALAHDPDFEQFVITRHSTGKLHKSKLNKIVEAATALREMVDEALDSELSDPDDPDYVRVDFYIHMLPTQHESKKRAQPSKNK
ncbi:ArsR family transcriptional regulator [Kamptonema cortianum]|nr:ArsR family transcriptional regulator [Geitlerinema splendidum]MDK3157074.1 ArsR family transcriptional regulator [Kamptonema cortianum]